MTHVNTALLENYEEAESEIRIETHQLGVELAKFVAEDVDKCIQAGLYTEDMRTRLILSTCIDIAVTGAAHLNLSFKIGDVHEAFSDACATRHQIAKQHQAAN